MKCSKFSVMTRYFMLRFMSQSQALLTLGFLLLNKVSPPYYSTVLYLNTLLIPVIVLRIIHFLGWQTKLLRVSLGKKENKSRNSRFRYHIYIHLLAFNSVLLLYTPVNLPSSWSCLRAILRCVLSLSYLLSTEQRFWYIELCRYLIKIQ